MKTFDDFAAYVETDEPPPEFKFEMKITSPMDCVQSALGLMTHAATHDRILVTLEDGGITLVMRFKRTPHGWIAIACGKDQP